MKLVNRHELMQMPKGTIYRAWEPAIFSSDWMRLGDVCRDGDGKPIDWFEETIGPRWCDGGGWQYQLDTNGLQALPDKLQPLVKPGKRNGQVPDHFSIDGTICREGCFDENIRYLVLDTEEVLLMVKQLTTGLAEGDGVYYEEPK